MSWKARWFDGRDSAVHAVIVDFVGDALRLQPADASSTQSLPPPVPASTLRVSDRFAGTARRLQLPDGSTLAVDELGDSFDAALQAQGHRRSLASTLMQSTPRAVACLIALLAFLVWMDRQGAGLLAGLALPAVPTAVDQRLGITVRAVFEERWMAESQVPDERQAKLTTRIRQMVEAQHPDLAWNIMFRNMRESEDAFNAFALPDGTIVLLDGLTGALTDEQVIAVVAHELGHVVHRHTMQRLLRQVGLLATASVMLGDISGIAAALSAGYQDLHYSRDAEREADVFAIDFMRRANMPVRHIAEAFDAMREQESSREIPGFLSSHPPTEERARLAREAGGP